MLTSDVSIGGFFATRHQSSDYVTESIHAKNFNSHYFRDVVYPAHQAVLIDLCVFVPYELAAKIQLFLKLPNFFLIILYLKKLMYCEIIICGAKYFFTKH